MLDVRNGGAIRKLALGAIPKRIAELREFTVRGRLSSVASKRVGLKEPARRSRNVHLMSRDKTRKMV